MCISHTPVSAPIVGFYQARLCLEHVTQQNIALPIAVLRYAQQLMPRQLRGLRHLNLLAGFDQLAVLMRYLDDDLCLDVVLIQGRLLLGEPLFFRLFAFSSPVVHVPGHLHANHAQAVWKDRAEVHSRDVCHRQADIGNALGALEPVV
jgi:hypothetical protein